MITFEQLPTAVSQLQDKLDNIERLLLETAHKPKEDSDQLLTVDQCAEFLSLSKPTIYGLISQGKIPCMKQGKRVYFSKAEVLNYLRAGRKKSLSELQMEADQFLVKKKVGR